MAEQRPLAAGARRRPGDGQPLGLRHRRACAAPIPRPAAGLRAERTFADGSAVWRVTAPPADAVPVFRRQGWAAPGVPPRTGGCGAGWTTRATSPSSRAEPGRLPDVLRVRGLDLAAPYPLEVDGPRRRRDSRSWCAASAGGRHRTDPGERGEVVIRNLGPRGAPDHTRGPARSVLRDGAASRRLERRRAGPVTVAAADDAAPAARLGAGFRPTRADRDDPGARGFGPLAVAVTWPLAAEFSTRITGERRRRRRRRLRLGLLEQRRRRADACGAWRSTTNLARPVRARVPGSVNATLLVNMGPGVARHRDRGPDRGLQHRRAVGRWR